MTLIDTWATSLATSLRSLDESGIQRFGGRRYVAGTLAAAFLSPMLGFAVFVGVALLWLVPDRRMEHALARQRRTSA